MCIDSKYKEWEQPYFAFAQDGIADGICINDLCPQLIQFFRDQKIDNLLE
jgi:hypothetical protein